MFKKIILSILPFAAVGLFTSEQYSDNGKAGYTGSPGENACTNSGCHTSFAINSGGGSIASTSTMTGWQYIPGTTYSVSITVVRTGTNLFGTGVECLDPSGNNAGTLIITDAAHTSIKTRSVGGVTRRNVVHTLNGGASAGYHTFTFNWTAPATNIGNVTFYYAGVAANGNGSENGDYVYTGSQLVTPMNTTGISEWNDHASLSVYPNPVLDQLHVNYSVKQSGSVQIRMFDMNGRLVHDLINANRQPGAYEESFPNIQHDLQGLYLLQIVVDGSSQSQKILIQ